MISFIKGKINLKANGYIILVSNDIGYKIYMSDTSIGRLKEDEDGKVTVYTYLRVLEDDLSLYGFETFEELNMFELMISVSGIGAKTALIMLSSMTPQDFALAVISEDISAITKIPGIGPKGAKRIILELKDKVEVSNDTKEKQKDRIPNNKQLLDAIDALCVLGFIKKDIENVFEKLDTNGKSSQELIKIALKYLR